MTGDLLRLRDVMRAAALEAQEHGGGVAPAVVGCWVRTIEREASVSSVLDEERRLARLVRDAQSGLEVAARDVRGVLGDGTQATAALGAALRKLELAREDLAIAERTRDVRRASGSGRINGGGA
jgi:hypothetical protein